MLLASYYIIDFHYMTNREIYYVIGILFHYWLQMTKNLEYTEEASTEEAADRQWGRGLIQPQDTEATTAWRGIPSSVPPP